MAVTGTMVALTALSTGYSIYSGERANTMQRGARRRQETAQNEAKQAALSQQIKADQANAAANRKQPDVASLLAFEQQPSALSASMLSGGGRRGGRARPTLLGDA